MANTLTSLIPDITEALDTVSREMVGMVPAVRTDTAADRVAIGQNLIIPITPVATSANNTPGVTAPDTGDQTIGNVTVSITKSKHVPVRWNGEETKGLQNAGTFSSIQAQRFYQGIRALVNEMEVDLWTEGYQSSSRGYGTAATAPFGTASDLSDFAGVARILDENGCPTSDRQLVLGHAAIANLRGKQSVLFKVNEAGSADMLRNGMTDRVQNFALRHSDAVGIHTKGTGASYLLNDASSAIGDTSIAADTGSGTILAGDVVTFAGTSDKYIVNTALSGGAFTIGEPGLIAAETDNDAITVGNNYTANLAFDRNAIILANRMPALPEGGDAAEDAVTIVDPVSGLVFEVALYKQFLQNVFHVRAAWGVSAVKSAHIATLLG